MQLPQLPDRAAAVPRKRVQAIAVSLATAVTIGGLVVIPAVTAQAAVSCATGTWTEQFFANAKLSGAAKKTVCDAAISENWGPGVPPSPGSPRTTSPFAGPRYGTSAAAGRSA